MGRLQGGWWSLGGLYLKLGGKGGALWRGCPPGWDGDACAASPAVSGDAYEELLRWCQASTAGYRGVEVTDFTASWTSGLALCALVHRFRPDLVDFHTVDPQDPIGLHQMMLDTAEQELGIQPVLSSTEMASMAEPDRLGLITYLSQFYEAFKPSPALEVSKKPLSPRGTKGAILFLSKLQKSRTLTHKRAQESAQKDPEAKKSHRDAEVDAALDGEALDGDHSLPPAATTDPGQPPARGESSDACYFCGRRVYILERASAEGRFFHRGCFQCWQCGATLRLGDYAFHEEDGHFYCLLHYPNAPGMDMPPSEPPVLPDGDVNANRTLSDAGSPCASPEGEEVLGSPQSPPATPEPGEEPGAEEDAASTGEVEEQELPPSGPDDVPEEDEGPGAEPRREVEEAEEGGGRRKIVLSPLEKLSLSTLSLTGDAEAEAPPKPARLRLQAAPEAMPALWPGLGAWEEEEEEDHEVDMEEDSEESDSEEEEEEEEEAEEKEGLDLGTMGESCPILGDVKYATCKRTLPRRVREAQMKRFCKAQAIQRRLEEIEVTFRELEQQGIKLEKFLRDEGGSPADQKTQWMNQLLYLVQKKNSLMSEESDLMIAVQELKLEEQQWQLDQQLRWYMEKEEALKTAEDCVAEKEILAQLLDVVNKRNALIQMQEEKRLSELHA